MTACQRIIEKYYLRASLLLFADLFVRIMAHDCVSSQCESWHRGSNVPHINRAHDATGAGRVSPAVEEIMGNAHRNFSVPLDEEALLSFLYQSLGLKVVTAKKTRRVKVLRIADLLDHLLNARAGLSHIPIIDAVVAKVCGTRHTFIQGQVGKDFRILLDIKA